jgi:hypothetical protein
MVAGRLPDRIKDSTPGDQGIGGQSAGSANDSPAVPAGARLTATEAHRIARTLTDQDRSVIEVLDIVRMASGGQLRRLLWADTVTGHRLARHHLAKLTRLRVLARLGRQIGGVRGGSSGHVYTLDVLGQRLADAERVGRIRRPSTPSDAFVDHAIATSETYVGLLLAEAANHIELVGFDAEPDCWRRFTGPGGRDQTLKPDAFAQWRDAEWESAAFFEIDLGTENPGRLTRKAHAYVTYHRTGIELQALGLFPEVIWITPSERRVEVIRRALDELDPESRGLFSVTTPGGFAARINQAPERR